MRPFGYYILVSFCIMLILPGNAVFGRGGSDGWVLPKDGDTLRGSVDYNWKQDIVQVSLNNRIKTFTAFNTKAFAYYSSAEDTMRHFYPLSYKGDQNMPRPRFFEVVVEGELDLLIRDSRQQNMQTRYDPMTGMTYPFNSSRKVYLYYFRDTSGTITKFEETKKHLYQLMEPHADKIKSYMKKHRLRYYRRKDLKELVQYYNSLS